ncbi:calcium-binding protein, partial [Sphingosinicella sp. LHD-64]|uniref:calcium-binding protein n=1 Tax=Sphingosinicella sp. LHD-64 TaxID=3072139 RepID=UPI00280ED3CE
MNQDYVWFDALGRQEQPTITRLADGGFVISWISDSDLYVQRFDAQGQKLGGEQLMAGPTSVLQASVVGLGSGDFVVAWSETAFEPGVQTRIQARTFDASGTPKGDAFTLASGTEQQPHLAARGDDEFVVVWTDNGSSGVSNIKARVFSDDGTAMTGEIVVTSNGSINSYDPDVVVQADGDFVVTWTGPNAGSFTAANGQVFDGGGNPKSAVFSSRDFPDLPSFHEGFFTSIAMLASGEFVMTWTDSAGNSTRVLAQRYTADGAPIGAYFRVNPADGVAAGQPSATALDDGGFLVTWRPEVPGEGPNYFQQGDIWAQRYDAIGNSIGAPLVVNTTTALGQDLPAVAAFGSGDFAVVWRTWDDVGESYIAIRTFYSATTGTSSAETIVGTADADAIRGLDGADTLQGLDGRDLLDGDAGDDILEGGDGDDVLHGGNGRDILYGGSGDDLLNGDGNTTGPSGDTLYGGDGNDTLIADDTALGTRLYGEGDDDHLVVGSNIVTADGGDGDDWIEVTGGNVTVVGGAGNDLIFYNGTTFSLIPGSIDAGAGDDRIVFVRTGNRATPVTLGTGQDVVEVRGFGARIS